MKELYDMNDYRIMAYSEDMMEVWDEFVLHKSVNGTFLHTRNFLNYHPYDRFQDCSVMILKKNKLVAVVPACEIKNYRGIEFYSHKGSTYGGIVVKTDYYFADRLMEIVECLDSYLSENYVKATLKITADIHSKENLDLLQYCLRYYGYRDYEELNTYIDLRKMDADVLTAFDRNKIRNIRKCEQFSLLFRELISDEEIEDFHKLLTINLSKYNLKPIHTPEELKSFKNSRIPDNVRFYGVFQDETMMAGGMMFVFDNVNVIHAQNLSADYRFEEYSPITYLYYRVIKQAKEDGYDALSWGISTEDHGKKLNMGLIRNKESYGSKHQLNRTYYKEF